jgi:2'-5' RNA ligase
VPAELEVLAADLRGALMRAGVGFDGKGFVSHVTLLRNAREPRAMPALEPIEWKLDGFALVHSLTLPQGSRYQIVKSWRT